MSLKFEKGNLKSSFYIFK